MFFMFTQVSQYKTVVNKPRHSPLGPEKTMVKDTIAGLED
jgi:hypothetical protein